MELIYLDMALIINKKLYDDSLINEKLYDFVEKEIYKKINYYGFI